MGHISLAPGKYPILILDCGSTELIFGCVSFHGENLHHLRYKVFVLSVLSLVSFRLTEVVNITYMCMNVMHSMWMWAIHGF